MESVDLGPSVAYEGLAENKVNPNHLQERQRVIDGIRFDSIRNRDIHYAESPHFIVVFKNNKPYKDFDAPSMEGPEDLAYYLEGGLKIVKDKFQLDTPNTFQVVRVSRGRVLSPAEGTHSHGENGIFNGAWEYARFSKVHPRGESKKPLTPRAYTVALHEAIGHGFLAPAILSEEAQGIPFLNEGLSTYIEYLASGSDAHDYLRSQMISLIQEKFKTLMGDWKTDNDFQKALEQLGFVNFSVSDCFKLLGQSGNPVERRYDSVRNAENYADYVKGGSFIKYFIDTFGVDVFKSWSSNLTKGNFFESLERVTGKRIEEIEEGWKETVLQGFMSSPVVTEQLEGESLDHQVDKYNEMKKILDIYRVHSLARSIKLMS